MPARTALLRLGMSRRVGASLPLPSMRMAPPPRLPSLPTGARSVLVVTVSRNLAKAARGSLGHASTSVPKVP